MKANDAKILLQQIEQEIKTEIKKELNREMCLEILSLHKILFEAELKVSVNDLAIRKEILTYYNILLTETNIEQWYNLPIKKFKLELLEGNVY